MNCIKSFHLETNIYVIKSNWIEFRDLYSKRNFSQFIRFIKSFIRNIIQFYPKTNLTFFANWIKKKKVLKSFGGPLSYLFWIILLLTVKDNYTLGSCFLKSVESHKIKYFLYSFRKKPLSVWPEVTMASIYIIAQEKFCLGIYQFCAKDFEIGVFI